ncbi:hypothetical protein CDAR_320831 [Caerostris darwini]|uniref:Uncharacterized protein n=1 Tax=Caerostris darwini TaxID=1538125 RepID=A0AAV4WXC5_9ARAC|nr:hypothetical protein CDAR_320831 [Caerostris darwini]
MTCSPKTSAVSPSKENKKASSKSLILRNYYRQAFVPKEERRGKKGRKNTPAPPPKEFTARAHSTLSDEEPTDHVRSITETPLLERAYGGDIFRSTFATTPSSRVHGCSNVPPSVLNTGSYSRT